MSDTLIKFNGGQGLLNCMTNCGYTGSDNRVGAAITKMFEPDYAVAGLSLGGASQVSDKDFAMQALAAGAAIKGQLGR